MRISFNKNKTETEMILESENEIEFKFLKKLNSMPYKKAEKYIANILLKKNKKREKK